MRIPFLSMLFSKPSAFLVVSYQFLRVMITLSRDLVANLPHTVNRWIILHHFHLLRVQAV